MILTIDVGNTNIVFGVFEGETLLFESRMDTNAARMADQYAIHLCDVLRLYGVELGGIAGAIIASVVPPVTRNIAAAVERLTGKKPLVVGPGLKSGLNIKIDNPVELGADLVCGATAAKTLYNLPCIAVDLGTVTKVMALDSSGGLMGGVLAPGVGIGFKTMSEATALLPLVGTAAPGKAIGTNTTDCIRGGIIYGAASMLDGLIERFESELGEECTVVATGGFAEVIVPHCKREFVVDKSLVSRGLRLIYERNV